MPELPDLEYILPRLREPLVGKQLEKIEIFEPVVYRNLTGLQDWNPELVTSVFRRGPFLVLELEQTHLVIHPMLAGRFAFNGKKKAATAIRFAFSDFYLDFIDDKKMGKVYRARKEQLDQIPGYKKQGVDLLSKEFTEEYFRKQAAKYRKQVRVFLMDQSILSAIGNAYADEILFEAMIHPKTRMNQLTEEQILGLYRAIGIVLRESIRTIEEQKPELDQKYREHVKVRNRKDQPCPRCGSRIRRANVLGYDSFFCPTCQPDGGRGFVDWSSLEKRDGGS